MKIFTNPSKQLSQKVVCTSGYARASWLLLFVLMLCGVGSYGQNNIDRIGISTAPPQAFVAYSLRKVSNAYSGFAVRVRRSGDDAEADVAFSAVSNKVETTSTVTVAVAGTSGLTVGTTMSFATFMGTRSGFVSRWYNQSGTGPVFANNAVTTNTAGSSTGSQPRIVNAGTYLGYIENDATNYGVSLSSTISGFTNNSAFTILAAYNKFSPLTQNNLTQISGFYNIGAGGSMRYWHGLGYLSSPVDPKPQIITRPTSQGQQPPMTPPVVLDVTKPFLLSTTQVANSSSDGTVQLYINDVSMGSPSASTMNSFTASTFSPINTIVNSNVYTDVQLYEFIILNSKLSATDLNLARSNVYANYSAIKAGYPMVYYPGTVVGSDFKTQNYTRNTAITPLTVGYYTGATTATSFAVSPSLPNGMNLNTSTGQISGTPTVTKALTQYTITATDANGLTWPTYIAFQVWDPPSGLTYPTPNTFEVGVPINNLSPSSTGGVITGYTGTLPAGLSLQYSTGVISGTPTAVSATASYTITGTNNVGSTPASLTITVNAAFQPGTITGGGTGGTETVCAGITPTTISDTNPASGGIGTISYQWQQSTTSTTSGFTDIAGATSASYTPPAQNFANTTLVYFRRAAYTPNNARQYSNVHTESYRGVLSITSQPLDVTVCSNTQATLTVASTVQGSNTHQWYSNTSAVNSGGITITGAINATYSPPVAAAGTTYYYVIVTKTSCGSQVTSNAVGVTTRPAQSIQVQPTAAQTVCNNTAASLSVTAIGGAGTLSYTYQWYSNTSAANSGGISVTGATASSYAVPGTPTAGNRFFYVTATDGAGCGVLTSTAASVTTLAPFSISIQPVASLSLCNNTAGNLSVTATGGSGSLSYTYQWYSNTSASNSGGISVTGATSSSYAVPALPTAGNRYYYVVITDAGGCGVLTSTASTVITQPVFSISAQPVSQGICYNTTGNLTVTAIGGFGSLSYTYQWYSNGTTNSNTGGTAIALSATGAAYTVPASQTMSSRYFYVTVTDGGGCGVLTSTAAFVNNRPQFNISTQPVTSLTVCNNTTANLTVAASGGATAFSPTFRWFSNTSASNIGGTAVTAALTATSYTVPAISTQGTRYFYVVASDALGCGTLTSTVSSVITNDVFSVTTQPLSTQTLCNNVTGQLSVTAAGGFGALSYKYQWYENTTNSTSGGTAITLNGTSASYTVPATSTGGTRYFYVVVTDGGGCGVITSTVATVVTNNPISIGIQPLSTLSLCNNNAGNLSVTAAGGFGALSYKYQWYQNTVNNTSTGSAIALSATASAYSVPATSTAGTTYYYVVVTDGGGCGAVTSTASAVITKPVIAISAQPITQAICYNMTGNLSVTATGGFGSLSYTYQWYSNTANNNTSGTPIALNATAAAYTVPATTTMAARYFYVTVTDGGGCGVLTSTVAAVSNRSPFTISSQPPASLTVCNNVQATLSVTSSGGAVAVSPTFQWYENTIASNSGGVAVTAALTSTSYTVPGVPTAGTRYYYVVAKDVVGCGTISSTVSSVTTNDVLSISTQPLTAQTVCNNVTAQLSVTAAGGFGALSYKYKWYENTTSSTSGGTAISLNGTSATYTVPATTTAGTRFFYVVVTDGGGCNSITSTVSSVSTNEVLSISVQPLSTQTLCNNIAGSLSVTAAGGSGALSYRYQWYQNSINSTSGGTAVTLSGTAATYAVPATTTGGLRYFYVVVTDGGGCNSITSTVSSVATNNVLSITTQPVLTQTLCNNTAGSLSVTAAGGSGALSYTYQWYENSVNSTSGGTAITVNGTAATYIVPAATAGIRYFYVVITDGGGCNSITSTVSAVTTNEVLSINAQPLSAQTICNNVTGQLSVTAAGGFGALSYKYQWYENTSGSASGGTAINLSGTSATYTVPATTTGGLRYFYVVATDGGGCGSITSTASTVTTLDAFSVTAQYPASQRIRNNSTADLSLTASGAYSTFSYQWYESATNSNATGTPVLNATLAAYTVPATTTIGDRYYYAVVTAGGCGTAITTTVATISTMGALFIDTEPLALQSVCNGTGTTLSVTADGASGALSFTYQWYINTTNSNTGGTPLGDLTATQLLYSVPATTTAGNHYYYVVVTDQGGGGVITSTVATVYTRDVLSISAQPQLAQTICNNTTANLSVTAQGASGGLSYTYQWYANTTNSNTGGTPVAVNGTSAAFTVPATSTAGDRYYYVVVTDAACGDVITSTASTITTRTALSITAQPDASTTLCINVGGTLSVTAAGGTGALSYGYQWYSNVSNSNNAGTPISIDGTSATYTIPATATSGDRYYYVVVTDLGCGAGISSTASTVHTLPALTVSAQPLTQVTCNNVPVNITAAAAGGSLSYSYQWFSVASSTNTGGNSILGANNALYTVPADANANNVRYYYAEITDDVCHVSVPTQAARITTGEVFAITSQPTSQVICNNTPVAVTTIVTGGSLSRTFQWYTNTVAVNSGGTAVGLSGTSATYTVPATATSGDRYYYAVITEGSCGQQLTTDLVTISTRSILTVGVQPAETVICNNTTKDITAAGSGGSGVYQYQWFSSISNTNTGGTNLGSDEGANTATYTIPATQTAGNRFFYVRIADVGCSDTIRTQAFTVVTGETLAVLTQPLSQNICNNVSTTVSVTPTGGTGAYSYQWYRANGNSNATGVSLGNAPGAQTSVYTVPAVTVPGDRYFYVVITDGGCGAAPIKSNPVRITTGTALAVNRQPVSAEICYNTTTNLVTEGAGSSLSYTYQWYSNTLNSTSGGTPVALSGTSATYTVPAETTAGDRYFYAVIKDANCPVEITTDVAVVKTRSDISVRSNPSSQVVCNGTTVNIAAEGLGGSGTYNYQWYSNSSSSNSGGFDLGADARNATYTVPATALTADRFYYAIITDAVCGTPATTSAATISTRTPLTVGVQPQVSQVIINNTTASINTSGMGASGAYFYKWYTSPANTEINGATGDTYVVPATATAGSRFFYAVITDQTCLNSITTSLSEIVTKPALTITAQPLSQTLCNNTSTVLNVTASGGSAVFSYQWYSNTTNSLVGASQITGANSAEYTVPASQLVTDRYYFVEVTDANLGNTITSEIARIITRSGTPVIVGLPLVNNTIICVNGNISLVTSGLGGSSGSYVYQWYSNTSSSTIGGTAIPNETNATYNKTLTETGTYYYYATVADPACGSSIVSNVARVQVRATPTITIAPLTQVVCKDEGATPVDASITGGAGTVSYQWFSNTVNSTINATSLGTDNGARTASFTPPTDAAGTVYYFAQASFTGSGCNVATSAIHTITTNQVAQASDIVITTPNPVLCKGLSTVLHAALSGSSTIQNPVFAWYADANFTNQLHVGADFATPVLNNTVTYYVKVSGSNACENVPGSGQSQTITVAAQAPEVIQLTDYTYCAGATTSSIAFASTISSTTFAWSNDNTAAGLISGGTGVVPSFTTINNSLTNTIVNISVTPFANGCTGVTKTFAIVVVPNAHVEDAAFTVCGGTAVNYTPTNVPAGKKYTWTIVSVPAGISGATNNAVPQSSFSQTLTNNTAVAKQVVYEVTPDGCFDRSFRITVTVNPVPQVNNQALAAAICSGAGFSYANFTGIVPEGTLYTWAAPLYAPSNSVSGGNAQGTKQAVLSEVALTNSLPTVANAIYTVTPYSSSVLGSCQGQPFEVTVPVNPKPTLTVTNAGTICNNGTAVFIPSSLTTGVSYTWTRALTPNIANAAANGTNGFSETLRNTASFPVLVSYEYTLTANGCSNTQTVQVLVNPDPVLNSPKNVSVCSGALFNYSPSSLTSGTSFAWSRASTPGIKNTMNSGTGDIFEALVNTTNAPVEVVYNFTLTANGCVHSETISVTVSPIPSVTESVDQIVCNGSQVQVSFAGSTIAGTVYNWTNTNGNIGLVTSGTGNLSFTAVNRLSLAQTAAVTVVPTANGCAGTAKQFNIIVNPTPTLSSSATPATVCSNTLFTYLPESNTDNVSFTWSRAAVNGVSNAAASGSGTIRETLVNTTSFPAQVSYEIVLTANGCSAKKLVFVTVNPTPAVATVTNQVFCNNSVAVVNFAGSKVANTTYNWTNDNTALGIATAGSGDIFFVANNKTAVALEANIKVTPEAGGCKGAPVAFAMKVSASLVLKSAALSPVCSNSLFTFTPEVDGDTAATISWTRASVYGIANKPASGNKTISETLINTTALPVLVTYVVTISNKECSNTQNISVYVNPSISINNSVSGFAICSNEAFIFSPNTGVTGTQFKWTRAAVSGIENKADSATGDISEILVNNTAAPVTVVYKYNISTGSACSSDQEVKVTVKPLPQLVSATSQVICSNSPVSYLPVSNIAGTSFTWSRHATNGISNIAASGLGTISENLVNRTTQPVLVDYILNMINANGCAFTDTIDVTVKPTPTVRTLADQAVCKDGRTQLVQFAGDLPNTVFNWTNSETAIGLAASGTGNIAAFTARNTTASTLTGYIEVIPELDGCKGAPVTVLRMNVNPGISSNFIEAAPSAACPSQLVGPLSASYPAGGDGINYTYQWMVSNDGLNYSPLAANGATNRRFYAPAQTADKWYRMQVSSGGCSSASDSVKVRMGVKPVIAVSNRDNYTVSIGNSTQVTAEGATSWVWTPRNYVSDPFIANPLLSPVTDTRYTVTGTNEDGCSDTASVNIRVIQGYSITPNNVLTPNGDGYNDTWEIKNIKFYPTNEVVIYNRNGVKVKTTANYTGGWNGVSDSGAKLATDVYYYVIKLKTTTGEVVLKGYINIFN